LISQPEAGLEQNDDDLSRQNYEASHQGQQGTQALLLWSIVCLHMYICHQYLKISSQKEHQFYSLKKCAKSRSLHVGEDMDEHSRLEKQNRGLGSRWLTKQSKYLVLPMPSQK